MYLTDYYRFEHLAGTAKTRLDCTTSTGGYDEFEIRRCRKGTKSTKPGDLVIYCTDVQRNENFNADAKRKADKSLTLGSKNITSIYTFEPDPKTGFGDFKDTQDALLFVFKGFSILGVADVAGAVIEIYVARGKRNSARLLYNLLEDGRLEDEMRELKKRARPDKPEGLF